MRKFLLSLIVFCALTVGVFILAFNVLNGATLEIDKSNWREIRDIYQYDVVYAKTISNQSSEYYEANPAQRLIDGLKKASDNSWNLGIVEAEEEKNSTNKKIYCYNTNLDSSLNESMGDYDFRIELSTGNNIYISGKTNKALLAGVDFFINECVIEKNGVKNVYVPTGSGYFSDYAMGSNKIDNIDITNFYIVVDDANDRTKLDAHGNVVEDLTDWGIKEHAQKIQEKISQISSVVVPIVSETNKITKVYNETDAEYNNYISTPQISPEQLANQKTNEEIKTSFVQPHEIYISGFSNLRTDAMEIIENFQKDEYFVGIKNGKLLILGQSALALKEACDYFLSQLNTVNNGRFIRFSSEIISKTGIAKYPLNYNIFVDAKNGVDTNNGEKQETAVKTIYKALKIFNKYKTEKIGNKFAKVNINLLDGNYKSNNLKVEVPFNISLTIKAFGEAKPVIDSLSNEITLEANSNGKYSYQFKKSEDENYSSEDSPNYRQVYVSQNGEDIMATMAESNVFKTDTKALYYDVDEVVNKLPEKYNDPEKYELTNTTFMKYPVDYKNQRVYIDASIYSRLFAKLQGYEELWFEGEWQSFNIKITDVGLENELVFEDLSPQTFYYVTLEEEGFYKFYNGLVYAWEGEVLTRGFTNRMYSIKNSFEYLGSSGNKYVYDYLTATIHFASNKKIKVVNNSVLFNISKSQNITFSGLSFTGVEYKDIVKNNAVFAQMGRVNGSTPTAAAIYGTDVTNILIENCKFYNMASNAVLLKGIVNDLIIKNNKFTNIGMSAIVVGNASSSITYKQWAESAVRNVVIDNNIIDKTGTIYPAACAIFVPKADGIFIRHNTISNTSYTAISLGFNWSWSGIRYNYLEGFNINRADISYNHITNFMQVLQDGGAIYVLGANCTKNYTKTFNYMHDNYAYNSNAKKDACIYVYYLDGSASNWEVYNNAGGGGTYGVYSQIVKTAESHNNLIRDMYIITNSTTQPIRIHSGDANESNARNVKCLQNIADSYSSSDTHVKTIKEKAGSSLDKK